MVRIRRSHRRGPGSIPGQGTTSLNQSVVKHVMSYVVKNVIVMYVLTKCHSIVCRRLSITIS